jgi:hypothetical protein
MLYQITIRHGRKTKRYHSLSVEAEDAVVALRMAADGIPRDIAGEIDIVELREAPDFDKNINPEEEP